MASATTNDDDDLATKLTHMVQALTDDEKQAVDDDLATARALVDAETSGHTIPKTVTDKAILEVGADLYFRRMSRNGIVSVTDEDMQPFRINRDPLAAARPILRPFMPSGIGIA